MVVEALQEHRARQDEEKLVAGKLWRDHDLVFTTTVGTQGSGKVVYAV